MNYLRVLYFCFFTLSIFAQDKTLDSLFEELKVAKENSHKVIILNNISLKYGYINPDTAFVIINQSIALAKKHGYKKELAIALRIKGILYYYQGNYIEALRYYSKALEIFSSIKDKEQIAATLNNIGLVYHEQSNYPKALEYYFKSLKIEEELGDKISVAITFGNIGIIYDEQSNYSKALMYYFKALQIAEELDFKELQANTLMNIGVVYRSQLNYSEALKHYFKALKIAEELDRKQLQADILSNIGIVYEEQSNYTLALEYYFKSLRIYEYLGDKRGIAVVFNNISTLYFKTKQYKKAEQYLKKSIALSDSVGLLDNIRVCEKMYSKLDSTLGKYKSALEHYKKYIAIRDTINNIEKAKQQVALEMTYEFEKKQSIERAEQEKREAIIKEEKQKQKVIIYSISIFSILILILCIVIFRNLVLTKKINKIIDRQRQAIEVQKRIVEEKNKDIIDSITYAKRIQRAILPNEKQWHQKLPDSFVIYLPKDIVAGDFYWLEEINDYLFVAAADCTGHGVPGAMISVICSSALTKAILEEKQTETNKILDRAREIVIEQLSKSDDHIQDGMDICLIRINKKNTKEIQYSGANRPLIIITRQKDLIEIKPDKQPIGLTDIIQPFSKKDILLNKEDTIYLFTDGYSDQFGGKNDKKLSSKRLLSLMVEYAPMKIEEQKQAFIEFYNEYKGKQQQTDDVTLIGIKI